jgi:hypothetical protein
MGITDIMGKVGSISEYTVLISLPEGLGQVLPGNHNGVWQIALLFQFIPSEYKNCLGPIRGHFPGSRIAVILQVYKMFWRLRAIRASSEIRQNGFLNQAIHIFKKERPHFARKLVDGQLDRGFMHQKAPAGTGNLNTDEQ